MQAHDSNRILQARKKLSTTRICNSDDIGDHVFSRVLLFFDVLTDCFLCKLFFCSYSCLLTDWLFWTLASGFMFETYQWFALLIHFF